MAESSIFWITNGTGDGTDTGYTQTQMFEWLRSFFTTTANLGGVAPDYQDKLAVSGTSSPVSVATGAALVYGIPYVNTAAVNVAIPTPSGATRIDRIVLRADYTAQTVRITRIAGTEGGAAPSLTQSAGTTWDIPLAQVSITTAGVVTVTDQREWLSLVGDGAVTTAKLAADAVTGAKIADDTIGTEHYIFASVDSNAIGGFAVDTGHINPGAVNASKLATGAVENEKIAASAVSGSKIAAGAVDNTHLASNAVTTTKILDSNVTEGKLSTGAVTEGKLATGAVTTTKIADDAVTVDKAGAGLPVLTRRQGGSATDWTTYGTTTYTPSGVRMQAGCVRCTAIEGSSPDYKTVTFPVAFSNPPLVFVTFINTNGPDIYDPSYAHVTDITASQFVMVYDTSLLTDADFHWLAIGPE